MQLYFPTERPNLTTTMSDAKMRETEVSKFPSLS